MVEKKDLQARKEALNNKLVASTQKILVSQGLDEKKAFELANEVVAAAWCILIGGVPVAAAAVDELRSL